MQRLASLGLLAVAMFFAASAWAETAEDHLASVNQDFTIKGKPVHPGVLRDLEPLLSDRKPYIVTIDLAAAAGSNKYFDGDVESSDDAWVSLDEDGRRFSYLWLGRLANGLHVVRTADATLVCHKSQAEQVKALVARARAQELDRWLD